jgi:hypothetical protein
MFLRGGLRRRRESRADAFESVPGISIPGKEMYAWRRAGQLRFVQTGGRR